MQQCPFRATLESLGRKSEESVAPTVPEAQESTVRPFEAVPGPKGLPIVGTLFHYFKKDGLKFSKMFEVRGFVVRLVCVAVKIVSKVRQLHGMSVVHCHNNFPPPSPPCPLLTHTHTCTHARTRAQARTHARTHAHTHTHTLHPFPPYSFYKVNERTGKSRETISMLNKSKQQQKSSNTTGRHLSVDKSSQQTSNKAGRYLNAKQVQ